MNIFKELERLVQYGIKQGLASEEDRVYVMNQLLALLKIDDYQISEVEEESLASPTPILENILDWADENDLLESNSPVYRDLLDTQIMACLMPRPSEIIKQFADYYQEDKQKATDYYYHISCSSDYVRQDRIKKDRRFKAGTKYGDLDITINLSKPEKDPKAIAAARNLASNQYPKCLLCKENEGYIGRINHPARGNHRIIPVSLNNESWFLQYSPYAYYNEHCIVLKGAHEPMQITKETFTRLLDFVEMFPHYFIGSNADLPIVGGSILSHDHFQGGNYEFPMARAKAYFSSKSTQFPDVTMELIEWPLSVIRLKGNEKSSLIECGAYILNQWRGYTDKAAGILAFTDNVPHNTITPIARMRDGGFELDLVLRNNLTSTEHPDGIYHPHQELHHIKKENIGLIEVMGLAVLPARLKDELEILRNFLVDSKQDILQNEEMHKHIPWYESMLNTYKFDESNVEMILENEVGNIFASCLEHCGVYKLDEKGKEYFKIFIDSLNK